MPETPIATRTKFTAKQYQEASDELQSTQEQLRLLVESVSDYAIYLMDKNGQISTWNRGAERIKGWTRAEIIGQPYELFFTEEDRKNKKPRTILKIAAEAGKYHEQAWRVRKDGTKFYADILVIALYDSQGRLIGYGKVTRDLT